MNLLKLIRPRAVTMLGCTISLALLASCGGNTAGSPSSAAPSSNPAPNGMPTTSSAPASGATSASASAVPQGNGQLGMVLEVNNAGWQKVLSAPAQKGMIVVLVIPNQPADKAGLKVGDVVSNMNGVDIFNANVTNREIRKLKVADKVSLNVARKNGAAKVDLTVDAAQQLDLPGIMNDLVKQEPNNPRAYFLRGAYAAKDAKSAQDDFNKAISLQPDFVSAYVERGTMQEATSQDNAMADFNKAIAIDSSYEPAYVNRSVLFSAKKAYAQALQDDQKAVQLDSTDPAAYTNLGIGFVNTGDSQQAMTAENQAVSIDPQFGPALLYRGLMYRDASRTDLQSATRFVKDPNLLKLAQTALQQMSTAASSSASAAASTPPSAKASSSTPTK